jgi:hypothetical protein
VKHTAYIKIKLTLAYQRLVLIKETFKRKSGRGTPHVGTSHGRGGQFSIRDSSAYQVAVQTGKHIEMCIKQKGIKNTRDRNSR